MRTSKKALTILLATMCVGMFGAVGCSGEKVTEEEVTEEELTEEEVTINFWHHYSEQSAENEILTNVLIPEFEKENPNIKVNAVSHEWSDLHDKILVSAKSETLPDVARLDSAWIPEFQKMGILVPLNQEIEGFQETADSLLESAMSTAKIGDDYYGLALNTNTKIMFYNKRVLEDAGVSVPETMDEFVEVAKKLAGTNENGQQVWGYEEPALSGWNLCPFIWSMGGSITNEEQTQATGYLNSPETVAAIQMLADLYSEEVITGWNRDRKSTRLNSSHRL